MLVMEYADGDSLRNYLKHNFKNLNWNDKCQLSYQIATAVECLHEEGILHRDLVIKKKIFFLFIIIFIINLNHN